MRIRGAGARSGRRKMHRGTEKRPDTDPRKLSTAIRIPAFINDEDVGLGDIIKRITSSAGISPCGACARRAARLNRWLVFGGRHRAE